MKSISILTVLLSFLILSGCKPPPNSTANAGTGSSGTALLNEARRGFQTQLLRKEQSGEPLPQPPGEVFRVVQFDSPVGKLAAYLSPDPGSGKKHPAIIWITGGDCNTIGDVWSDAPLDNDQTASAYRNAGIIMMFPSLRGGNQNPGYREAYYGEVDDVLAATDFLAKQPHVDPGKIYLGGHSTGGTLVLLVAETSNRFRAVFSFGPADSIAGYGVDSLPFNRFEPKELELRSPGQWLHSVQSPTFVFEGREQPGNANAVQRMMLASHNPLTRWSLVSGTDHFSVLARVNDLLAKKILADDGPTTNIEFSVQELHQ